MSPCVCACAPPSLDIVVATVHVGVKQELKASSCMPAAPEVGGSVMFS